MKERVFYSELAYLFGLMILAAGTALMERANFGVSMVVAPAYLLHLKLSQTLPFFSFGMAEYLFQGVLLLVMSALLRRFRLSYLFSFATAVLYGFTLDGAMALAALLPGAGWIARATEYALGLILCSLGVSLLFHTYISPEVYELWVKEMSARGGFDIHKYKTAYDCTSCLMGILLSFLFFGFGRFEGVKLGTILCALVNGSVIGFFSRILEERFAFRDALPLRRIFAS